MKKNLRGPSTRQIAPVPVFDSPKTKNKQIGNNALNMQMFKQKLQEPN